MIIPALYFIITHTTPCFQRSAGAQTRHRGSSGTTLARADCRVDRIDRLRTRHAPTTTRPHHECTFVSRVNRESPVNARPISARIRRPTINNQTTDCSFPSALLFGRLPRVVVVMSKVHKRAGTNVIVTAHVHPLGTFTPPSLPHLSGTWHQAARRTFGVCVRTEVQPSPACLARRPVPCRQFAHN